MSVGCYAGDDGLPCPSTYGHGSNPGTPSEHPTKIDTYPKMVTHSQTCVSGENVEAQASLQGSCKKGSGSLVRVKQVIVAVLRPDTLPGWPGAQGCFCR